MNNETVWTNHYRKQFAQYKISLFPYWNNIRLQNKKVLMILNIILADNKSI